MFVRLGCNDTYIGTMLESAALLLIPTLCREVGDVAVISYEPTYEESYDADYHYRTFYYSGAEVISFDYSESYSECNPDQEEILRPIHTRSYNAAYSGFKYSKSDKHFHRGMSEVMPYIKRQMRRTERRVGKLLTREDM